MIKFKFLETKYTKNVGNLLSVLSDLCGFVIIWLKWCYSFAIVIKILLQPQALCAKKIYQGYHSILQMWLRLWSTLESWNEETTTRMLPLATALCDLKKKMWWRASPQLIEKLVLGFQSLLLTAEDLGSSKSINKCPHVCLWQHYQIYEAKMGRPVNSNQWIYS